MDDALDTSPFAHASRPGARAARMNANGADDITLGAGEPDLPTPDFVKAAIDRDEVHYTALHGTPDPKEAVRANFARGVSSS